MAELTLIVPDAAVAQARAIAASFGPSATGMWTTPLSATGTAPATHWISAGPVGGEFAAFLPVKRVTMVDGEQVITTEPADPVAFAALCEARGITPPTQAAISAIFAVCDVSDQGPFQAMERLGLQIVRVPLQ